MSDQFQEEVNKYEELNPKKSEVRPPSKFDRRNSDGGGEPPTRKSLRLAEKETKLSVDLPWVFLDQHVPGNDGLEEICRFQFHCGVCLSSSGTRDSALLMNPVPSTANKLTVLVTADTSTLIVDTVKVHVFGFPSALASDFNHFYTITPAEITGSAKGLMPLSPLSCSGLSGSVIVCTETDRALGYLCGVLNTPENEQFRLLLDETVLDNLLLEEPKPSAEIHTK
ncbi:hypothetical protein DVH05_006270 [Phytophthora capsici]|nr:hypothetical protein DVH05_006270 [Phytophthora capsici]